MAAGLNVVEAHAVSAPGTFAVCFRSLVGSEVGEVLRFGRLSDLTVMARNGAEKEGGLTTTFDAALFDSGRPVLLVPGMPVAGLGSAVAIAWDGSVRLNLQDVKTPMAGILRPSVHTTRPGRLRGSA